VKNRITHAERISRFFSVSQLHVKDISADTNRDKHTASRSRKSLMFLACPIIIEWLGLEGTLKII